MIDNLIGFSIRNKLIIGIFTLGLIVWGIFSLTRLPIDAVPDITNNQVQIITTSPTLAAQEIEQYITFPVEQAMATVPDIIEIRSISRFGLSVVTVVFEEDVDIYKGRQLVFERLKEAGDKIPEGLGSPEMGPVSTGLGEIYQYVLSNKEGSGKKYSLMELRTIQDWIVKRQLLGTPGIAEVSSFGGYVKQYQVSVSPDRLMAVNISINDIYTALEKNNSNTGGAYIEKGPNASFIRGMGTISSIDDIENIVIKETEGIPLLIRDVAQVEYGSAVRYGALTRNGEGEAVGGIVLMLKGKNTNEIIDNIKKKIETIRKSLPEGIELEVFLDRSELIERTINTVTKNLVEGGLIVIFVLVLLLGNLRAGFIVASVIPLAMLFAISMMNIFGVSGNLMSLGAIDFGLIVDGAVIIVEAIVHRITFGKDIAGVSRLNQEQMDSVVYSASIKIRKSAAFGEIIILIVYLPILALVGVEGKMFKPMAQTVSFAILGALLLSLTYVPMMSALFLSKETTHKRNISDKIIERLEKLYSPILEFSLRKRILIIGSTLALFLVSLVLFLRMGGEFIPTLNEGDLALESSIAPGSSLSQSIKTFSLAEEILMREFPSEVKEVISKIGSSEIPTDPMPIEAADITIILNDEDEWKTTDSKEELIEKMEDALSAIPGLNAEFTQPIQLRFNELLTGVKQDVAVKIYGEDLDILFAKANEAAELIRPIAGVGDLKVEQTQGLPQIMVQYNRQKLAQHNLSVDQVNRILNAAFAGSKAGIVYEGEKRFDLVVRMSESNRKNIKDVKNLFIPLRDGNQIPLSEVANIEYKEGAMQISRDDTKRRITVGINVRDRDVESMVEDVQQVLESELDLPPGYYITYGGQFENLIAANERLRMAVPIALALIFVLLFFTFHSVKQTLLIFTAIPLAAIGGVLALLIRDMPFSISAGVGFIALFGVAVLNGIVLIGYFNELKKEGIADTFERIRIGAKVRLRPVIMTAAVASFGFLPMAISESAGAEVQRPLATVVIGGLVTSTLLTLLVLPVLYSYIESGKGFKIKNTISVLALLMLVLPFQGKSQENGIKPITLKEALDQAYQNSPFVESATLEIEKQQKLKGTSLNLPGTNIGFQYGNFDGPEADNAFSINQKFDFPTVYSARTKLARENIDAAQYELAARKNTVAKQVKLQYMQLSLVKQRLELLLFQDSLYQEFFRAAEIRYKTGETAYLEKVAAETRLKRVQNELRNTFAQREIYQRQLQKLIGTEESIDASDDLTANLEIQISDSVIGQNNPYLNYLNQQIEIAQAKTKLEKAQIFPDFSIGFTSQTLRGFHAVEGNEVYFGHDHRFEYLQAGISVPLWFKPQKSQIQAAKIQNEIAKSDYQSEKLQMQLRMEEMLGEYISQQNNLKYFQEQAIPQADLLVDFAKRSFMAGEIGYIEFFANVNEAISIRNAYLDTLYQLNLTQISLEYLIGEQQ